MPYLSLGKTNLNYNNYEDEFIITMILDTSSSYQYPILVRDTPTLDIYFGKNFKYRDFLNEMISMGVSLYLYRPIQELSPNVSWTDEIELLKKEGVIDEFIPTDLSNLPSNFPIAENSPSWRNRDTLRLFNHNQHNGFSFDYCYPYYDKDYKKYRSDGSSYIYNLGGAENSIDNYQLDNNYETLAFKFDFSKVTYEDFKPNGENCRYIVIPYLGYNYMVWFRSGSLSVPEIPNIKSSMHIDIDEKDKESIVNEFKILITSSFSISEPFGLGYEITDEDYYNYTFVISKKRTSSSYNIDNKNINIQSPEKNYQYFSLPNLIYDSDFRRTNDILSEATEDIKQLEFYSKTIGKGEDDIKIVITRMKNASYEYKIIISRYDYEEHFEVNLSGNYKGNIAPLASTINKNSKLVSCKLFDRITDLPEGEFYLRGSWIESYDYSNRRQALEIIKETEINDDVLIIDDLELWKSDATITGEDLKIFLEYSTYKDNQTYITNRSYRNIDPTTGGYNIYHEHRFNITDEDRWVRGLLTVRNSLFCNIDVILNIGDLEELISDKQNRLVYFYNDMSVLNSYRPGCYVFLRGLLTDNYSVESEYILYEVPNNSVIRELPEHKSNYMLYNNSYYFYPRYQNGDTSKVTTVTRFMISRIGREFKKHKWDIISSPIYKKYQIIDNIIRDTLYKFSIIRSLNIEEMEENDNTLTIRIRSEIKELVVKDIVINITLNYN